MSVPHSTDGDSSPVSAKGDEEKNMAETKTDIVADVAAGESTEIFGRLSVWRKLANYGVELRGVEPVPEAERTDTRYLNVGTWLGASMLCLLPYVLQKTGLAKCFFMPAAKILCLGSPQALSELLIME